VIHRILLSRLLCVALILGGNGVAVARPQPAASRPEVAFRGFVNWDFRHRRKLKGWKATAIAIQKMLDEWHPGRTTHTLVENGTPGDLRKFLHSLPTRADCDLSIVYLASHQSPAAEWDFVQKKLESLDTIVGDSDIPRNSARIVIVDACYAAALGRKPAWEHAVQSLTLFASLADEETQELDFRSPQPVDLRRRYPAASEWLNGHMGKEWNGKLSFLGFVWVQTFVTSKNAPRNQKSWVEFLQRCGQTAEEFRRNADKRLASEVTLSSPTGAGLPAREPLKR
jgi:hypothetical protein